MLLFTGFTVGAVQNAFVGVGCGGQTENDDDGGDDDNDDNDAILIITTSQLN
jgi:hypothetical protein